MYSLIIWKLLEIAEMWKTKAKNKKELGTKLKIKLNKILKLK